MFLSSVGFTIFTIVVIALVILFLLFERNIFHFFVKKVSDSQTKKEITDKDINTPSKIYTYKVGGTNFKAIQDVIKILPLKTELLLRKVEVKGKTSFCLFYKEKPVGYLATSFINKNFKDIQKGAKYHIISSKIDMQGKKYVLYVKIWKHLETQFDLTDTLKKFDYRIGDKVEHKEYGVGIVREIRMNSVVVEFKKPVEITDFKSLKLITM